MKKPWFRQQSKTWVITLPGGKIKTLGGDEHGATRKYPPPEIEEAWHAIDRQARPNDMLLCDVVAKYLDYLTNPATKRTARENLDRFMAFTGKKIKVSALRVHHVTDFLKSKKTWADSTKATAINRITSALNYAQAEGYIEDHKVRFARGKKPRYGRRETILTRAQQKKLEDASHPALRRILVAMRESGARPGELCVARIEKVELRNRVIMVPNKSRGKTGIKERPIYLSPTLTTLVRECIGDRTEGAVFLNGRGTPWKPASIAHRVRKLRIKLKLPNGTVPYIIRHGFVSNAINDSDANAALVAKLAGHVDLNMLLKVYFKEKPEAMRRAIDQITKRQ